MRKFLSILLVLALLAVLAVPVLAYDPPYLVDDADLFTTEEEAELETGLYNMSWTWDLDIVVVTATDLGGKSSQAYADDFFDYGGYGSDGILWLIDMENRMSTISTTGSGISIFTDSRQDHIQDVVAPMLSDGDYYGAVETFTELCGEYCRNAENGGDSEPVELAIGFDTIVVCLVIGFVIAFIITAVMKGQLKSVRAQAAAGTYVKAGSLELTESSDLFLYRHIDRRQKPKNNGGSSIHRSSSGRSHGGSSRRF